MNAPARELLVTLVAAAAGRQPLVPARRVAAAVYLLLVALGVLGAAVAAAAPAVGTALYPGAPRPTFYGQPAEAVDVFLTNLTVLSVPFLLSGAAAGRRGPWRTAADLVVPALAVVNAVGVGVALGRFGGQLLPFLPHLPVEAAALAVSTSTWLRGRSRRVGLARPFLAVVFLAAIGAGVEVFATPRAG